MAKEVYKIPTSMEKSALDSRISLKNSDGIGFKAITLRAILAYIVSGLGLAALLTATPLADGHIAAKIFFGIFWVALTVFLISQDRSGAYRYSLVPVAIDYASKENREAICRSSGVVWPALSVIRIKDVDDETGMVTWDDDWVGYVYRVVGTGSILLFDEDRRAILSRVDLFWRKVDENSNWIFLTTKEAQQVYRQIAALKRRYDALEFDDPDARALLDMQYRYLKEYVGGIFRSVHQYLIIKAPNVEQLQIAKNTLAAEVESSGLMFRQCTALFEDDQLDMFRTVYKGKETV